MAPQTFTETECDLIGLLTAEPAAPNTNSRGLIVCGPPGSGKTTLVGALAQQPWLRPATTYVERVETNTALWRTPPDLAASQRWFLRQYEKACRKMTGETTILLDQDPRASVLVYSRAFCDHSKIAEEEYLQQLDRCRRLVSKLRDVAGLWHHIILRAPREILRNRWTGRMEAPSLIGILLDDIFDRFDDFSSALLTAVPENCHVFDTRSSVANIVRGIQRICADEPSP